jgi:hypothetical protein
MSKLRFLTVLCLLSLAALLVFSASSEAEGVELYGYTRPSPWVWSWFPVLYHSIDKVVIRGPGGPVTIKPSLSIWGWYKYSLDVPNNRTYEVTAYREDGHSASVRVAVNIPWWKRPRCKAPNIIVP